MLQQTRVAVVIPYYERFLEKYPTARDLAEAPEQDVLAAWSGLGYYSRARNLQKAARQIAARGEFPYAYSEIRQLAGAGDYTAAAVASIAFGLPHAALDGNVIRVISRLRNDASDTGSPGVRKRFQQAAQELLDPADPGGFNQAMMELGATVCLPRNPQCLLCPVRGMCTAQQAGRQNELPVKIRREKVVRIEQVLLILERRGKILMWQRPESDTRMPGFWELPSSDQVPDAVGCGFRGSFSHSITFHRYRIDVLQGRVGNAPQGMVWVDKARLAQIPVSSIARKALKLLTSRAI